MVRAALSPAAGKARRAASSWHCSASVKAARSSTKPSISDTPPPWPWVVQMGTPAADRASTSRYTVRTDTSSLSASCPAVSLPCSRSRYTI